MTYHVYHDDGHHLEIEYSYNPVLVTRVVELSDLEELIYENDIVILGGSYKVDIDIKDGFIYLGNAKFPMQFKTKGLNETLSVFGQFFMSVELYLDEL